MAISDLTIVRISISCRCATVDDPNPPDRIRTSAYQYSFRPSWISRAARVAMIWPKRSPATLQAVFEKVQRVVEAVDQRIGQPLALIERVDQLGPELQRASCSVG